MAINFYIDLVWSLLADDGFAANSDKLHRL
jgi:hypothetical protein